jgi:hypothetical protein
MLGSEHLYLARPVIGGKVHEFDVYFHRDLFDTPENRVITSGLTFWLRLT